MNEGDEMNDELIKKQVLLFLKSQQEVHVMLKSGRFRNGLVQEISSDFFEMHDKVLGLVTIFYQQVQYIEQYKRHI